MKKLSQSISETNRTQPEVSSRSNGSVSQLGKCLQNLPVKLACSGWGRVALHLLVAVKTGHYMWHVHGIVREIVRR